MTELIFTFGIIFFFILFLVGIKVFARIVYLVLFFPMILGVNKLLVKRVQKEKIQNKLKEKGEEGASIYLLRYFEITQTFIGIILIVIYSVIMGLIFQNFTESYVLISILSVLYFGYCFFKGRYKYKPSEDDDIQEIAIEGLEDIDIGDLITDIDFDIDIDI